MKKYNAIVFDVDGTLIDSFPDYSSIMKEIIPKYRGQSISEKELMATFPLTIKQTVHKLGIKPELTNQMEADYMILNAKLNQAPSLYPGIKSLFKDIDINHPDVALGIVTSGSRKDIQSLKNNFNFMKQIWVNVTADLIPYHKPAPEPLLYAIDHMGVDRKEALYIGDATTDEGAARNARVDFGLAGWGTADSNLKNGYTKYDFQSPQDILKYLK